MSTSLRRFHAADGALPRRVRKEISALLAEGGVVALPTETVYGLAVRADDAVAVQRLRDLKGRDPRLPLTWHVGSREPLESVEALPNTVRRLGERYWPGPLTLVVRARIEALAAIEDDGWLGMRLPAHTATSSLLEALPFPVAMSSANRSGAPPAGDADEVEREFEGELAFLVDGGETRLREASAVLRVGPGRFELLREGLFAIEELRRVAGLSIAFVCTGNTCRSPMAEVLARRTLTERLGGGPAKFGFEVASMGVAAGAGSPASEHAVSAMRARDLDLTGHASRSATLEAVSEFDHAFGLTRSHVEALRALLPPKRTKIVELLDPDGEDVPDPIGGTAADYEHCAEKIASAIEKRAVGWV